MVTLSGLQDVDSATGGALSLCHYSGKFNVEKYVRTHHKDSFPIQSFGKKKTLNRSVEAFSYFKLIFPLPVGLQSMWASISRTFRHFASLTQHLREILSLGNLFIRTPLCLCLMLKILATSWLQFLTRWVCYPIFTRADCWLTSNQVADVCSCFMHITSQMHTTVFQCPLWHRTLRSQKFVMLSQKVSILLSSFTPLMLFNECCPFAL